MKKILFLIFLFANLILAQSYDLNNMVKHEYAFAELAKIGTTKDAFLSFLDNEGIIFRPHPVNGKTFLEKSKPNNGWLIWYPERAGISSSGDIGYTTGPASFRKEKGDSVDIWFGNFCTVWRKQKDNSWKFLIDFGISNEKPVITKKSLQVDTNINSSSFPVTPLGNKIFVKQFEGMFDRSQQEERIKNYFVDSRLLVEGFQPIDGDESIKSFLAKNVTDYALYSMIDGDISSANDFMYAYGTVKINDTSSKAEKENYYLRVWQKQNDDWKIMIEVWNEKPKE
ncbi:MAG: hypothetical protein WCZ90_20105 [Melioribacteraceae bacterium]